MNVEVKAFWKFWNFKTKCVFIRLNFAQV